MKKKIKVKEFLKKIKELWAIPRYRAIIKLSLYGIMFLLIIIMANISNNMSPNNKADESKSYSEIINVLDLENAEIMYDLKITNINYKLEGKIANNILTGYLDNYSEIKKIAIKENNIFEIKNNEELINEELNEQINIKFLIPKNIIDIVKNETAYINKGTEETTYTFKINENNINYEVVIFIKEEKIINIKVKNEVIEYNMLVDFDKKA